MTGSARTWAEVPRRSIRRPVAGARETLSSRAISHRACRFAVPLALALLAPAASTAAPIGFDAFLARAVAAEPAAREALVRQFVLERRAGEGLPIVEADGTVVFLYLAEGGEESVRLVGDFSPQSFFNPYWDAEGEPMERVGPLFYRRHDLETDARLDYAFRVDGELVPDPENPRRIFSGVAGGEVSELVMPEHRLPAAAEPREGVPRGTLEVVDEAWATPKVTVYLPPGYDPAGDYATLYTTDGAGWLELLRLPTLLDNLIAEGAIEPIVAVLVDAPEDRRAWHYFSPDYLAHFERVVAHVDRRYATRARPGDRVHAGTSSGGRAALFAGLERPELFARLALLSPELSGPLHVWSPWLTGRHAPDPSLEVFVSAGTYEPSIHQDALTIARYLEPKVARVTTRITHEGHSFGTWRGAAEQMLRWFFGSGRTAGGSAGAG